MKPREYEVTLKCNACGAVMTFTVDEGNLHKAIMQQDLDHLDECTVKGQYISYKELMK